MLVTPFLCGAPPPKNYLGSTTVKWDSRRWVGCLPFLLDLVGQRPSASIRHLLHGPVISRPYPDLWAALLPLLSPRERYFLTFGVNLTLLLGFLRAQPVCRGGASAMSSGSVTEPVESEEQLLISAVSDRWEFVSAVSSERIILAYSVDSMLADVKVQLWLPKRFERLNTSKNGTFEECYRTLNFNFLLTSKRSHGFGGRS